MVENAWSGLTLDLMTLILVHTMQRSRHQSGVKANVVTTTHRKGALRLLEAVPQSLEVLPQQLEAVPQRLAAQRVFKQCQLVWKFLKAPMWKRTGMMWQSSSRHLA